MVNYFCILVWVRFVLILKFVLILVILFLLSVKCVCENCIFLCGSMLLKWMLLLSDVFIFDVLLLFLLVISSGKLLFVGVLKGVGNIFCVVVKFVVKLVV